MKVVVLCFAHKDSELLNVQIRQFFTLFADISFYIHLDKKASWMRDEIIKDDRINFIENAVSVTWGDDSIMQALFSSINQIYYSEQHFDTFIITTGQDLIVNKKLPDFIQNNLDKIFLDMVPDSSNIYKNRVSSYFPRFLCQDMSKYPRYYPRRIALGLYYRLVKNGLGIKKRKVMDFSNIKFYYSFNWSVIPYCVFEYMVNLINDNKYLRETYSNTFLPEDAFLGTIIMNSEFRDKVQWLNDDKSYTLTYHSSIYYHPKVLTITDINDIEKSGLFFARKFDSSVDKNVIDYYKNLILEK